ncbi:MAG: TrbG/VirB9 family P-type conjugative transfer protein [Candidatus Omnitrophica bacterium]|nr:TrbG/VirB9 family P-type conjugative transfer protein [Candidatus Omnitrophota bacterium]
MNNRINFFKAESLRGVQFLIVLTSMALSGCASDSGKMDIRSEQPLIQIPVNEPAPQIKSASSDDIGFEDISLSAKKRLQVLTNKMEIDKETDNYVNNGQAAVITRPDGTILFPYGLAQIHLTAKRMMYSKIILQEGEKIMSAAAGDTTRWNILPNYIGNSATYTPIILVKPFMGGLQTSLSIITDKRDYDITVQSVDSGDYMPRAGFYYPQDKADAVNVGLPPDKIENNESKQPKINIENIKYNYRIKGDPSLSWFPTRIFEDGNKVFIRMSDHVDRSQLPIFMMIDHSGQPEVVNYRYFKPYFVVDTIFDRGVLILGTDKYKQVVKLIRV